MWQHFAVFCSILHCFVVEGGTHVRVDSWNNYRMLLVELAFTETEGGGEIRHENSGRRPK